MPVHHTLVKMVVPANCMLMGSFCAPALIHSQERTCQIGNGILTSSEVC